MLFDFYVKKNTNEEAHNKLFLFQNELFLASKTRISDFTKNLFLSIDNEINENYQIKSISTNEIKKDNLFQQKLNSNQQEINSKKNEINTLEDSLNKVNDDLWISNVIEEDVCVVFQRYEGSWDRGYYTLDEIENF